MTGELVHVVCRDCARYGSHGLHDRYSPTRSHEYVSSDEVKVDEWRRLHRRRGHEVDRQRIGVTA